MNSKELMAEAREMEAELIKTRRYLHENPETGFELTKTVEFVKNELINMGYHPQQCGKAGLIATAGVNNSGKVFLIRGDMDALPIQEESGEEFASKNGKMHACGHDMHTTMLLGAARLLKKHESELNGIVKLMFQPAEEIFCGSKDMIQNGLLKNPDVDAALMIHVMAGMPFEPGTAIVCAGGVSAPAADYFTIKIQGKGCHGSMPNTGVDPITVAAHIILGLQEIQTRELGLMDDAIMTIGKIHAGIAENVIPDTAELGGTIRTYDEEVRAYIKERMEQIAKNIATAYRAEAEVIWGSGCPVLDNDADLSKCTTEYLKELLGSAKAFSQGELLERSGGKAAKSTGSEDFAYVSQEVPAIMLALAAGKPDQGYPYPQHHPKVRFDESVLASGTAVYAYVAMKWLEEH